MKKIVVFASGEGSNAENIVTYFHEVPDIKVGLILSNNSKAGVLERSKRLGIPSMTFDRRALEEGLVSKLLKAVEIDFVVLAGFLWKVPLDLVNAYSNAMVNIHPSLLPKYGGKGMYGMNVHQAVSLAAEQETGISIHWVNERYDEGDIIAQFAVPLKGTEHPEEIAAKVHQLEYLHYPQIIEKLVREMAR